MQEMMDEDVQREQVNQLGLSIMDKVKKYFQANKTEQDFSYEPGVEQNEIDFTREFIRGSGILKIKYFTLTHRKFKYYHIMFTIKNKGNYIVLNISQHENNLGKVHATISINNTAYIEGGYNIEGRSLIIELTDRKKHLTREEEVLKEDPTPIDELLKEREPITEDGLTGRSILDAWADISAQIYSRSREMRPSTLQTFYSIFKPYIES